MLHSLSETPDFAKPDWVPTDEQIAKSNIGWLMQTLGGKTYAETHQWSVNFREDYWQLVIEQLGIRFREPYKSLLDTSHGIEQAQWLSGAQMNIAESCFNSPREAIAIVHQCQDGPLQHMSYGELDVLSSRVASNLRRCGFGVGETIAIMMPMTADAVAIYLGILKAGCVVVGIADSFQVPEIQTRQRISQARLVFTQDVILRGQKTHPLYENTVAAGFEFAVVLPALSELNCHLRTQDQAWNEFLQSDEPFENVVMDSGATTNLLFSSGTTGDPKAIPWNQTTPIKCAADAHFHQDVQPDDVVIWPTNLGWMMGPWLIFASLMNRATMAIYSGNPSSREFGVFVQNAKATIVGVIPSLVKGWRLSGCLEGLDWSSVKLFSSTGECSNAADMRWLMEFAGGKPIIEYCGGTEIGGSYLGQTLARPIVAGTFNTPILGWDFRILDEQGSETDNGELFLIPPSIGCSTKLLNADHHAVYYADAPVFSDGTHLRRHGDQVKKLPNGYWQAQGRADDSMNLGGIKVSSAEIERVLQAVPEVSETAAVAISDHGGPSLLVIYVVKKNRTQQQQQQGGGAAETPSRDDTVYLRHLLQTAISTKLNPLFKIHEIVVVDSLPRTASNKVMRRTLRKQFGAPSCRQSQEPS